MSSQSNLFNTDSYSNLCINFNLKNKNLNDLKSNKDYDSLTFESKQELINKQKGSLIKGNELLYAIIYVTIICLIILLFFLIRTSIMERKKEFALLRSIGLNKGGVLKLLITELLFLIIPTICLAIAFSPIIGSTFTYSISPIYGISDLSKYNISLYHNNWLMDILVMLGASILMFVLPLKTFFAAKNKSAIDELKQD